MAYSQNKLLGVSNLEQTYISTGFANWKEATSRFASHEGSRCHKDALLKMVSLNSCYYASKCSIIRKDDSAHLILQL